MEFPAPFGRELSKEEAYIADLDAKTGASLKLTILNPSGRVWTLVAGGGASVVYADAIASAGYASQLANYGEYSGAPTETQTFHYAKTVLDLMLRAPMHPEGKVLFIGGGIANFTNVSLQSGKPSRSRGQADILYRSPPPSRVSFVRSVRSHPCLMSIRCRSGCVVLGPTTRKVSKTSRASVKNSASICTSTARRCMSRALCRWRWFPGRRVKFRNSAVDRARGSVVVNPTPEPCVR